jgi:peptide/nickel transport system permease protein/oligopeptide transport system permease protein
MLVFILRRLIGLVFVLLSILTLTFVIAHAAPGDPVQTILGQRHDPQLYRQLQHYYGLDKPEFQQFVSYALGVLHGDFGYSYQDSTVSVGTKLWQYIPVSLSLGLPALVLSTLLGIPLGVLAAVKRNSTADTLSMGVALVLYSVPTFVMIPVLLTLNQRLYDAGDPYRHFTLPVEGWGDLQHAILPVAVLAAPNVAYIARLARTSILAVLQEDYLRTARAKGLPRRLVIFKHALRVALLPIITYLAPAIALLVTGTFIVENLFNIPGVGFGAVDALNKRDYAVVQGLTIVIAAAVVVMNLLSDFLYSVLDPRIGASS